MSKVAFLTTIFPMPEYYLYDFFDSLENQTYKEFEIVVVNDGYEDISKLKEKYSNLKILEIPYSSSIAKNREHGINYIIENGYDILIFGDSDDYFEANRIQKSLELLKDYDIVINDLSLFDKKGVYDAKYFSNRLKNLTQIEFEFIRDKNIFGLSNTSIKLDKVNKVFFLEDLIAVDWYLFSMFLLKGKIAVFTNETVTYYRQYSQNIVGLKELDKKNFERAINVKRKHYEALASKEKIFLKEIEKLSEVNFNIKSMQINYPFWWELI